VELNNDYSVAKVYWDTFDLDNKDNVQAEYESLAPRLRTGLAKTLTYRQMPKLVFHYDSQFVDALRIEELVK
jgi:ribosome-binding factor A